VLVAAFWTDNSILLHLLQVEFSADDVSIFGPLLEGAYGVVHRDETDALSQQLDEVVLAFWGNFLCHIVQDYHIVVPIARVFKYLAMVLLVCVNVFDVVIAFENSEKRLLLEPVSSGDNDRFDFCIMPGDVALGLGGFAARTSTDEQSEQDTRANYPLSDGFAS